MNPGRVTVERYFIAVNKLFDQAGSALFKNIKG